MKEADDLKDDMDISKTMEEGDAPKAEIGHSQKMLGFVVWIGNTLNIWKQLLESAGHQMGSTGEIMKQRGCDLIYALIGTLSAEYYSNQELIGIIVIQLSLSFRIVLRKVINKGFEPLLSLHPCKKLLDGMQIKGSGIA